MVSFVLKPLWVTIKFFGKILKWTLFLFILLLLGIELNDGS